MAMNYAIMFVTPVLGASMGCDVCVCGCVWVCVGVYVRCVCS